MPELTHEQKVALFRATADNMQARNDYAASRAEVILPLINEQSTIRSIFQPVFIGNASPVWDIPFEDIDCVWTMPGIGQIPTVQVEGKQITINTFGVDGGVDYQMDVAKDGRFDVAQLSTRLLANNFIRQEEASGWNLIKTHAAVLPSAQKLQAFKEDGTTATPGSGKMSVYVLNELITMADEIGIGGRRVTDIYLSPRRFGDMRHAISQGPALPEQLRMALWGNGKGTDSAAEIRLHKVYRRTLVPDNKAFAFTQKDGYFYGKMPIREEITTRDNPISVMEWKIGVIGRGRYGFGIMDDKGLIEITF